MVKWANRESSHSSKCLVIKVQVQGNWPKCRHYGRHLINITRIYGWEEKNEQWTKGQSLHEENSQV